MRYEFTAETKSGQQYRRVIESNDPEAAAKDFAILVLQFRDGPVTKPVTWTPAEA